MESERRAGIVFTLLGVLALASAVINLITTTGTVSYLISTGFTISGLSMSGVGIGILLGKVETIEEGTSRRFNIALAIAGIVAFAVAALVTIGILLTVE